MSPPTDLILIQEPYYRQIGTNPQMAQGAPIFNIYGCPKHPDWQAVLPQNSSKDSRPNIMMYIPSKCSKWTSQL